MVSLTRAQQLSRARHTRFNLADTGRLQAVAQYRNTTKPTTRTTTTPTFDRWKGAWGTMLQVWRRSIFGASPR